MKPPPALTITVIYLILAVIFLSTAQCYDWTAVDQLLDDSINKHAFPGCVALVADKTGILYLKAKGNNIYPGSSDIPLRPMTIGTRFDMASVTKVLTTTTATALLYQNGYLPDINNIKVSELFPEFASNGKESITVANLMLHNSGLRPDPVPSFPSKTFGCPETSKFHPELSFSCLDKIYDGVMSQPLVNPVGSKFVYSDLSMITMMYVVGYYVRKHNLAADKDLLPLCANSGASDNGKLVCYYEAYARKNIYEYLGMKNTTFITAQNVHDIDVNNIPPAWNDTGYRHELIHGYVSDSNAYALGGISGHAGMFSTALDIYTLVRTLMFYSKDQPFLTTKTMEYFTMVRNLTQSSRAYGWDTNWDSLHENTSCGTLSPETYMHTGYTGTNTCNDPKRHLMTILLTNRVYPNDSDHQIIGIRTAFNTAVQKIYDQQQQQQQQRKHALRK